LIPLSLYEHTNSILFEEKRHIYTVNGETYESGTHFIKKFTIPFDSALHSSRVAKKEGVSQEEILARWDFERDSSTVRGNGIHKFIEDRQRGFIVRPPNKIVIPQYRDLEAFLTTNKITRVFNEFRTCNHKLKIAGTMDALYWKDGKFCILDWKTNKKLNTDNPYKKYCKYPFTKIADTELGHYYLQINLYRYMIAQVVGEELVGDTHYVVHFPHEGEMKVFEVPNLQKEMAIIANFS